MQDGNSGGRSQESISILQLLLSLKGGDGETERQKRPVTKMHWIPPPVSVHKATSKTVSVSHLLAVLRDRTGHPQLIHATKVCFVSRLQ